MSATYTCAHCGVVETDGANGEWILFPDETYPDYWLCLDCLLDDDDDGQWTFADGDEDTPYRAL